MNATKRPWRITEYTNYRGFAIESERDPAFGCIAHRWEENADNLRFVTIRANAHLIVKAVNLHDEMVEVLTAILPAFDNDSTAAIARVYQKELEHARALLQRAKGE